MSDIYVCQSCRDDFERSELEMGTMCPDCGGMCELMSANLPYPVRCARCGADGTSNDMTPVECDEWECLPCFERLCKAEPYHHE